MAEMAPTQAAILAMIVCILGLIWIAHRLDKRAQRRKAWSAPRPGEARREHVLRLARLRAASTQRPPLPGRMPGNPGPGPGLRPHPVYGTETRRPWVIPPADLPDPYATCEPDSTIQICTLADVAEAPRSPAGHHAE